MKKIKKYTLILTLCLVICLISTDVQKSYAYTSGYDDSGSFDVYLGDIMVQAERFNDWTGEIEDSWFDYSLYLNFGYSDLYNMDILMLYATPNYVDAGDFQDMPAIDLVGYYFTQNSFNTDDYFNYDGVPRAYDWDEAFQRMLEYDTLPGTAPILTVGEYYVPKSAQYFTVSYFDEGGFMSYISMYIRPYMTSYDPNYTPSPTPSPTQEPEDERWYIRAGDRLTGFNGEYRYNAQGSLTTISYVDYYGYPNKIVGGGYDIILNGSSGSSTSVPENVPLYLKNDGYNTLVGPFYFQYTVPFTPTPIPTPIPQISPKPSVTPRPTATPIISEPKKPYIKEYDGHKDILNFAGWKLEYVEYYTIEDDYKPKLARSVNTLGNDSLAFDVNDTFSFTPNDSAIAYKRVFHFVYDKDDYENNPIFYELDEGWLYLNGEAFDLGWMGGISQILSLHVPISLFGTIINFYPIYTFVACFIIGCVLKFFIGKGD